MHVSTGDHNNKRTKDIPILGTTASLTAGQPLALLYTAIGFW